MDHHGEAAQVLADFEDGSDVVGSQVVEAVPKHQSLHPYTITFATPAALAISSSVTSKLLC